MPNRSGWLSESGNVQTMKELHPNLRVLLSTITTGIHEIGHKYCEFPIASRDSGRPNFQRRERVYCYELYHQMRVAQGLVSETDASFQCTINAEPDKSGHPIIKSGFNPDFIFHKNGGMENFLVMEVKVNSNDKKGIVKDFQTITCMIHCYKYQYGAFLIYGSNENLFDISLKQNLLQIAHLAEHTDQIFVFFHSFNEASNAEVRVLLLSELLGDAPRPASEATSDH